MPLRQPIVVVMGHVDHGKTSLLDAIRKTSVAKKEAGAITQHIGASEVPLDSIKETCAGVLASRKISFSIPGLLFIDTPGHESFTHLRERGGSIADIAILVVDIMQGFQPQTIESIKILREFKTPFVVAANKVDLIEGWKSPPPQLPEACSIISNASMQRPEVQARLEELVYSLVGKLHELGMDSERFDRISDFTRQVAIIPVSAKSGEGLPELLLSVAGLSQKFLEKELRTEVEGPGKGSILEVKEEKGLGTTIDVILYDGVLRKNDEIIFGTINGPRRVRVRGLLKPKLKPGSEGDRFDYVDEVHAAAGVKIYAPDLEGALCGSPIMVDDGNPATDQLKEINDMLNSIMFESDKVGVIVKADTLGSLEALEKLLSSQGVEIKRASIGKVVKKDVVDASVVAQSDPYKGVVLSFNVEVAQEAEEEASRLNVNIFSSKVIYSLCDDYLQWVGERKKKAAEEAIEKLPLPAKIKVLPKCFFRASKPAIFGVEVLGGRLKKGVRLISLSGEEIGEIREMQKEGKPVAEAKAGEQLAISVEGAVCGKSFKEEDVLAVFITRKEAEQLLSSCSESLTQPEKSLLEETLAITDKKPI
ncbi:MAG: translation initiation factor IF-2 [Candidatus Micrarchaeota archaeon]|nr:translation initiation factor IF-2 [Candidatus Micrarchaeota archaeon]